jgi:hypothetical protein
LVAVVVAPGAVKGKTEALVVERVPNIQHLPVLD